MSSPSAPRPALGGEPPAVHRSRTRLGGFLLGMGVLHVVVPKPFEAIIPDALGHKRALNLLAAAAEATSGALLLSPSPRARRVGGALATATVIGVYPANIEMARKAGAPTSPYAVVAWLRLPLQFPMIAWAARHARRPEGRTRS